MNENKLQSVFISPEAFVGLLKEGSNHKFVVTQGLPIDAKVINIRMDWSHRAIEVLIQSETFPEVIRGTEPPKFKEITVSS